MTAASDAGRALDDRAVRRTVLLVLAAAAAATAALAAVHSVLPSTGIDRVVTLLLAASMAGLLVYLYLRPGSYARVIGVGWAVGFAGLVVPAWYYPLDAARSGAALVERLPPMAPALFPLVLVAMVFFPPRRAFALSLLAWGAVALPVLGHLALHPAEARTPRGLELAVMLGPVMLMVVAFVPFQRAVERWVATLQDERSRMQRLAERDGLTGLYNRRASEGLLRQFLAAPQPNDGLILFDIDRFKAINDRHGHAAGDEVLRGVAQRCQAVLRADDLFARWGGEEFLVLARGDREDAAVRLAERLRAAIADGEIGPAGRVTASFGAARIRPGEALQDWLARADAALYQAKAAGRDRVAAG